MKYVCLPDCARRWAAVLTYAGESCTMPVRMQRMSYTDEMLEGAVAAAVETLSRGDVIVYPTDTVYGIGVDATNVEAVQRIVRIKERDAHKPMLVMVHELDAISPYAHVTPLALELARLFLPGLLSLKLEKTNSSLVTPAGDADTLGIRVPSHPFCVALMRAYKLPIITTSVNISGEPQPRTLDAMLAALEAHAEVLKLVIDAGLLPKSAPSTLVDARGERAIILREGAITKEALMAFL